MERSYCEWKGLVLKVLNFPALGNGPGPPGPVYLETEKGKLHHLEASYGLSDPEADCFLVTEELTRQEADALCANHTGEGGLTKS